MRFAYILSGIFVCLSVISSNALSQELKVGQIWEYKTRPNETKSTLIIVQIDDSVIHVSVNGLHVKDPAADDGVSESIMHLPLDIKAFNLSKTKLIGYTEKLPEFEEGLGDWLRAKKRGEAKAITLPLKDVIRQVEIMINQ